MIRVLVFMLLGACSPMLYTHDVPNLAKVDTGVWRSGQIATAEGWRYVLETTHAKRLHVVKLNFDAEGSDQIATTLGIDVRYLPIQPAGDQGIVGDILGIFASPDMTRVLEAVLLLKTATADDVWLVHCTHGQDRTGFVVGVYRVLVDGWPKARAYGEMLAHNFHSDLPGLEAAWEMFDDRN